MRRLIEALEARRLLSAISGNVFADTNQNGVQDLGEPGIANQHVWLDTNNDGVWEPGEPATATDSAGNYQFTGLADGTYHVRYYVPPGFHQTNSVSPVNLVGSVSNIAFGVASGSAASGAISGYVFGDSNQNGTIDGNEFALPGAHVFLDTNNDGLWEPGEPAEATDATGAFLFGGLIAGAYHLRLYVPPGYHQTNVVGPINVSTATQVTNLGITSGNPTRSISGHVFADQNESGAQDAGEADIANQHVWLDLNHDGVWEPGEPAAVTDASGSYLFTNLAAGSYDVRYYEPPTFHQTTPLGLAAQTIAVSDTTPINNIDFGVAAENSGPLKIAFNYSYDTSGFFVSHPEAKQRLNDAAAAYEGINTPLASISPTGGNTWSETFFNPGVSGGPQVTLTNPTVTANTLVVYVGGRPDVSGSELGLGGPGGYSSSGSQSWNNLVAGRGLAGATGATPTAFAPWGGSISFSTTANWNFSAALPTGSQADFLSVAFHELGHLFGIGTAGSFQDQVSASDTFTGAHVVALAGSAVALDESASHFAQGTTSTVDGMSQEVVMEPSLLLGTRKAMTLLDYAGLEDVGWNIPAGL